MCDWLNLLGVHSRNISFDEDDSDVNMTVSDVNITVSDVNMTVSDDGEDNSIGGEDKSNGGEESSDDLDSADELYESFIRMMHRGKLPSSAYACMHVYIYRPSAQVLCIRLSFHDRSAKRSSSLVYSQP